MTTPPLCVVADIGGTNTRVALTDGARIRRDTIQRYRNADHPGIEPILQSYLADKAVTPDAICIDLAGPVRGHVGELTNLDWRLDSDRISKTTGAKTSLLINDLQAMGYSVAHIDKAYLKPIIQGTVPDTPPAPDAPRLVVNVGTGLNIAQVFRQRGMTLVPSSEAGHVSFSAQSDEEIRLMRWMEGRHGKIGYEEILSGRGFERIYRFLSIEAGEDQEIAANVIFDAFQKGDPRATHAARLFVALMGRYAGDFALVTMPVGGIYLVGGVAGHFAPYLDRLGFAQAFCDKGRFSDFMSQFQVLAVQDDYAALTGCAVHLAEQMHA